MVKGAFYIIRERRLSLNDNREKGEEMKVYFIGAGPGDPKLLTIKGKEIIEKAEVIIYAGSLVNEEILKYAVHARETHNSAVLNLEELGDIFRRAKDRNHDVARIHSGDPSIYGAIQEQMKLLDDLSIPYEVIPGISAFRAAAAALCQELTLPLVCQTITLTRMEGRRRFRIKRTLWRLSNETHSRTIFIHIEAEEIVEI